MNQSVKFQFVDSNNGYAVNYLGKVFKKQIMAEIGNQKPGPTYYLKSIYFTDNNIGYVVGGQSSCSGTGCIVPGSIVFKTTDGGTSWNKQNCTLRMVGT